MWNRRNQRHQYFKSAPVTPLLRGKPMVSQAVLERTKELCWNCYCGSNMAPWTRASSSEYRNGTQLCSNESWLHRTQSRNRIEYPKRAFGIGGVPRQDRISLRDRTEHPVIDGVANHHLTQRGVQNGQSLWKRGVSKTETQDGERNVHHGYTLKQGTPPALKQGWCKRVSRNMTPWKRRRFLTAPLKNEQQWIMKGQCKWITL